MCWVLEEVGCLRLRTTQQNMCPHMMLEESEDSGIPISQRFLVFMNLFLQIWILGGSSLRLGPWSSQQTMGVSFIFSLHVLKMLLYCVFTPVRTRLLKSHWWKESCAWWKAFQDVSGAHLYLNRFPFQSSQCLGAEWCTARAAGWNSCSSSWAVVQTVHWQLVPFAVFGLLCSEIIAVIIDVLLPHYG